MQQNILVAILLFVTSVNTADSDGKDFIFSFIADVKVYSPDIITAVIVIPSFNDSSCTFKYTQTSDNQIFTIIKNATFGKTNEISFNYKEILLETSYLGNYVNNVPGKDFRIFATCTEEVKLIGRISYYTEGWGEHFLIPSIQNAGNKYIFGTPSGYLYPKGSITIMPIVQKEFITINIVGYLNGLKVSNETVQYDTSIGQNQNYITVQTIDFHYNKNLTIIITGTSPIMLSYASYYTAPNNVDDKECGKTCYPNYVSFMPMPVVSKKCNSLLSHPDQRMITHDFTKRLYISPPNVDLNCDETFSIDVYNKDNINGNIEIINTVGLSSFELKNTSEIALSTYSGQMPMYRLGSFHNEPDYLTAYGLFAHYVPSVKEWVTGKTQFYTLAKKCYLEFYTDADGSNIDFIKVDGLILKKYDVKLNKMNYFGTTFGHFIMPLDGYGLHTFENNGKYVLYVLCQNVNSAFDGAGYLTGFNKRNVN
uniref:IgGFc_binding domain-containing protein n=1 Tax=Rhabditophanes sp. KR3021 TaxID=114890 RepID=A0AC35TVB1_9BILA